MKPTGVIVAMFCFLSFVLNAQNGESVSATGSLQPQTAKELLLFHGIYNNGTTVKKNTFDSQNVRTVKAPLISVSDTSFVMKGEQIFGKTMEKELATFLGTLIRYDGDSTDVYDMDLDLKFDKMDISAKRQMLEDLGFEFDKAKTEAQ
jgi:hypothetical protein